MASAGPRGNTDRVTITVAVERTGGRTSRDGRNVAAAPSRHRGPHSSVRFVGEPALLLGHLLLLERYSRRHQPLARGGRGELEARHVERVQHGAFDEGELARIG